MAVVADFVTEFMRGHRDCEEGKTCPTDASENYKRGYGTAYELEQVKAAQNDNK